MKKIKAHLRHPRCPTWHILSRCHSHLARIAMLDNSMDVEYNYTYPKNSPVINPRHFYQNAVLLDWVAKSPRPVSLRQLAFFGRKLSTEKIISSANFVRVELPVRISHRIREMQKLPYSVVSNEYLSDVYEHYYSAFDQFRRFPLVNCLDDNQKFCELLTKLLDSHLSMIPKLVMGAIQTSLDECIDPQRLDQFMSAMLCSRISRRVIAEQHLALSRSFASGESNDDKDQSYIGEVFLQCNAKETIESCAFHATNLIRQLYPEAEMPEVILEGFLDEATFPYIKSHLDYIIGELLRNSIEATVISHLKKGHVGPSSSIPPPPIVVSVSNTPQNVFIRISDQGGGVPRDILPHIWSFAKGPRSKGRLRNFQQIPALAGLSDEVQPNVADPKEHYEHAQQLKREAAVTSQGSIDLASRSSSLSSLTARPPHMKLGMGLPLSRIYAEYWDGALDLHSLEGYGCDVFLRISRLGNQSERLQLDRV